MAGAPTPATVWRNLTFSPRTWAHDTIDDRTKTTSLFSTTVKTGLALISPKSNFEHQYRNS